RLRQRERPHRPAPLAPPGWSGPGERRRGHAVLPDDGEQEREPVGHQPRRQDDPHRPRRPPGQRPVLARLEREPRHHLPDAPPRHRGRRSELRDPPGELDQRALRFPGERDRSVAFHSPSCAAQMASPGPRLRSRAHASAPVGQGPADDIEAATSAPSGGGRLEETDRSLFDALRKPYPAGHLERANRTSELLGRQSPEETARSLSPYGAITSQAPGELTPRQTTSTPPDCARDAHLSGRSAPKETDRSLLSPHPVRRTSRWSRVA